MQSIEFLGFIHSHGKGNKKLSIDDIEYAKRIINNTAEISKKYLLIVTFDKQCIPKLTSYLVTK